MNSKVLYILLLCILFVLTSSCDVLKPRVTTKQTREIDLELANDSYDNNKAPTHSNTTLADSNTEDLIESESIPDESVPLNNLNKNLLFIHHSVGSNWLYDGGLINTLNNNGYSVSSITYGWYKSDLYEVNGDMTDTVDWLKWFNDDVMNIVYQEHDNVSLPATCNSFDGQNTIIMFKSCYPNSDVGDSIDDEMAIYNQLLDYFELHTDKMFVLVTPPPMINLSTGDKTRELCNWLVDRENGWLQYYDDNNVYTFDLFNVLTHPDNHHTVIHDAESHIVNYPSNELFYDDYGDDHPNREGSQKATEEFSPLLDYWYDLFICNQ